MVSPTGGEREPGAEGTCQGRRRPQRLATEPNRLHNTAPTGIRQESTARVEPGIGEPRSTD